MEEVTAITEDPETTEKKSIHSVVVNDWDKPNVIAFVEEDLF